MSLSANGSGPRPGVALRPYEQLLIPWVNPFLVLHVAFMHGPIREARPFHRVVSNGPHQRARHGDESARREGRLAGDRRAGLPDTRAYHRGGEEGPRRRL